MPVIGLVKRRTPGHRGVHHARASRTRWRWPRRAPTWWPWTPPSARGRTGRAARSSWPRPSRSCRAGSWPTWTRRAPGRAAAEAGAAAVATTLVRLHRRRRAGRARLAAGRRAGAGARRPRAGRGAIRHAGGGLGRARGGCLRGRRGNRDHGSGSAHAPARRPRRRWEPMAERAASDGAALPRAAAARRPEGPGAAGDPRGAARARSRPARRCRRSASWPSATGWRA